MSNGPDYKAAYEILEKAVQDARRVLGQAHVHATLKLRMEAGELTAADEDGAEEEIAEFNRRHGPNTNSST